MEDRSVKKERESERRSHPMCATEVWRQIDRGSGKSRATVRVQRGNH
jgi:hypothetical protein